MTPKTKKIVIIAAVALAVAVAVWLIFLRKKGWEKEIDKLGLSTDQKKQLKQKVKAMLADPLYNAEAEKQQAEAFGVTYDQWVVLEAAQALGWENGTTNGALVVNPKS